MEEDEKRVKIVTLRVGARVKEGKGGGGGGGEKNTRPTFSSQFRVSTWRFREQNIRAPEENACTAG